MEAATPKPRGAAPPRMKVGILGSGDVGQALGIGFAKLGHDVVLGTRDPQKEEVRAWMTRAGAKARTGTFHEAAAFGELLVLAVSWSGAKSAIDLSRAESFRGKVVVDVTNPLAFDAPDKPPRLALGHTDSGGEQVQRWLPEAKVVKCFNIVNHEDMVRPRVPATMFYCGNDEAAKRKVANLLREFGWTDVDDIGGIEGARLLEPLAMLWVVHGFRHNEWAHAFKLSRPSAK